jgi:hypothetical protein
MHYATLRAVAAVILIAPACGGGKSTSPNEQIPTGSYTLLSINGQTPPITVALRAGFKLDITSATLTIQSSNRFINSASYTKIENGVTTTPVENCTGTFTASNHTIAFSEPGVQNSLCGVVQQSGGTGGTQRNYTGTWDGGSRITVDFDPTTRSIYQK